MIDLLADFNERTIDGRLFILKLEGEDLFDNPHLLDKTQIFRVKLRPSEGDFEVEADLVFQSVDELLKAAWLAAPIWSTIKRFD